VLPTDQSFTGPWATDAVGTTYFLGLDANAYPNNYSILALDSCGHVAWRTALAPAKALNGAIPDIVVDGDHVLYQWGTVDAFDRVTGHHLWNVDLDAYANERLALDDGAELGPLAVSSDGTAYLAISFGSGTAIASVDTAGNIATVVSRVRGDTGDISGFILDAANHLDILFNSVAGSIVTSHARDGTFQFSTPFSCNEQFLGPLASGDSFVVMQSGPCAMSLAGVNLFGPQMPSEGSQFVTLDAASNLYVVNGNPALSSVDASGNPRWATPAAADVVSAAVLATGNELFVTELPENIATEPGNVGVAAYDTQKGTLLGTFSTSATFPAGSVPPIPLILTAAGQLVLVGDGTAFALGVGALPDPAAVWPTGSGSGDRRNAAPGE
jgi:hypothetical protein